ncbi:unnamed protein product [Ixodes pacificus]
MYLYDPCFEISLFCLSDHNVLLLCTLVLDSSFRVAWLCMSEFSESVCQVRHTMYFILTRPLFCLAYWILWIVAQCVFTFALCNALVYIFVVGFFFFLLFVLNKISR